MWKPASLRFCFGVSLLAHALVFGAAWVAGAGREIAQLPAGDNLVTLTLLAAPDASVSEAPPAEVTPVALPPAPQPTPPPPEPIPEPPKPTVVAVVVPPPAPPTVELPPEPEPDPAKTVVAIEPTPAPTPQPIAASPPIVSLPLPQPVTESKSVPVTSSQNETRGDNSSPEPGTAATTLLATAGTRAHPAYRKNPEPEYPAMAKRRHQEGTVLLGVTVSVDGKPRRVVVKASSGYSILDDAAVQAVQTWEFEAARINSRRIESEIEVPIRFTMQQ